MREKSLPEQVVELTGGTIDTAQAELLIEKIRIIYNYPNQWMACFPAMNTACRQGLSRQTVVAVWNRVSEFLREEAAANPDPAKRTLPQISITSRIGGYVLMNGWLDHVYEQKRRQENDGR